ncbi:MAG: isochorismatase family protein [Duganella sp.]
MQHAAADSVLVLVDLQARLMPHITHGDRVVAEALRLARIAQLLAVPVIGTEQHPDALGANIAELKALCSSTVAKFHFDACRDGLVERLPPERGHAIVAGCEAHVCVLQTALGLQAAGLTVTVVSDAVGSRTERNHQAALARLAGAGITCATVEMLAFEWLGDCRHPRFREVLALVK